VTWCFFASSLGKLQVESVTKAILDIFFSGGSAGLILDLLSKHESSG